MTNDSRSQSLGSRMQAGYDRIVRSLRSLRGESATMEPDPVQGPNGEPPVPSPELAEFVTGTTNLEWFLSSGERGAESIHAILGRNNLALDAFPAVLDFGCGVGRVIRHFNKLRGPKFYGCDYNPRLIEWCKRNLTFAQFTVNKLERRLEYSDQQFGLVYALSVFTHLTLRQQHFWMKELGRILKPGSYLLISTHGEYHARDLPPAQQEAFKGAEPLVFGGEQAGTNICTTFHSQRAVREHLATGYEVIDFVAEGAWGNPKQDYWLLRKPA